MAITEVELSAWIIRAEQRMESLEDKVSNLVDEVHSLMLSTDRQITDERIDRERADSDLDSKIDSLRHTVDYG